MGQAGSKSNEERIAAKIRALKENPASWPAEREQRALHCPTAQTFRTPLTQYCYSVLEEFVTLVPLQTSWTCKEPRVAKVVLTLLTGELSGQPTEERVQLLLQACRRIFASGFLLSVLSKYSVASLLHAAKLKFPGVVSESLKCMHALITHPTEEKLEMINKEQFEHDIGFEPIAALLRQYAKTNNEEVVQCILDIFLSLLLVRIETTPFDMVEKVTATLLEPDVKRTILDLTHSLSIEIRRDASMLLKVLLVESNKATFMDLQESARGNGALLYQLYYAVSAVTSEEVDMDQRKLSRELVGLLSDDNSNASDTLLRILPSPMLLKLSGPAGARGKSSPSSSPRERSWVRKRALTEPVTIHEESTTRPDSSSSTSSQRLAAPILSFSDDNFPNIYLSPRVTLQRAPPSSRAASARKLTRTQKETLRQRVSLLDFPRGDWDHFFFFFDSNFEEATLHWNETCRAELRNKLRDEISDLEMLGARTPLSVPWDWINFEVHYDCLDTVLKVGPYFVKTTLDRLKSPISDFEIEDPGEWMMQLYHRCIVEDNVEWKQLILEALEALMRYCAQETMSMVPMDYLVWLLTPAHDIPLLRHQVLVCLHTAIKDHANAKKAVDCGLIDALIYQLTLVHVEDVTEELSERVHLALSILMELCRTPWRLREVGKGRRLPLLLQTLMRNVKTLRADVLGLVLKAIDRTPSLVHRLCEMGAISFLLVSMDPVCTHEAASILLHCHNALRSQENSPLPHLLPLPLVLVLEEEGAAEFSHVMSDNLRTDIIWNHAMREFMVTEIMKQLAPLRRRIVVDPLAVLEDASVLPIEYPGIDTEVCVGRTYLRVFNGKDIHQVENPEVFFCQVLSAFQLRESPGDKEVILTTLVLLLRSHPDQLQISTLSPMFRALSILDVHHHNTPCSLVRTYIELLDEAFSMDKDQAAALAKEPSLANAVVSALPVLCREESSTGMDATVAGFALLTRMAPLGDLFPVAVVGKLYRLISGMVDDDYLRKKPRVLREALRCLGALGCRDDARAFFLDDGSILRLVRMSTLLAAERQAELGALEEAANVLRILGGFASDQPSEKAIEVQTLLCTLLTHGLAMGLNDPATYATKAQEDFDTPILVWDEEMRLHLTSFLVRELRRCSELGTSRWNAQRIKFHYPNLEDEVVLSHVYLRRYNQQPEFSLPNLDTLFKELVTRIGEFAETINGGRPPPRVDYDVLSVEFSSLGHLLRRNPDLLTEFLDNLQRMHRLMNLIKLENGALREGIVRFVLSIMSGELTEILPPVLPLLHFAIHARATLPSTLPLVLSVIEGTCSIQPDAAIRVRNSGMILSILDLITSPTIPDATRRNATRLMGSLLANPSHGDAIARVILVLLPLKFRRTLIEARDHPQDALDFYAADHVTPFLVWNDGTRTNLRAALYRELDAIRKAVYDAPDRHVQWDYAGLSERTSFHNPEVKVVLGPEDEVFLQVFNQYPDVPLPTEPERFLEKVVSAMQGEHGVCQRNKMRTSDPDVARACQYLVIMLDTVCKLLQRNPRLYEGPMAERFSFVLEYVTGGYSADVKKMVIGVVKLLAREALFAKAVLRAQVLPAFFYLHYGHVVDRTADILSIVASLVERDSEFVPQLAPEVLLVPKIRGSGGLLMLLDVLLTSKDVHARREAAHVMNLITTNRKYGKETTQHACKFLTPKFGREFRKSPEEFIEFFDRNHEEEGRVWNDRVKRRLTMFVFQEMGELVRREDQWDGKTDLVDPGKLNTLADV